MSKKEDYGERFLYAESLLSGKQYHTVQVKVAEVIPPGTLTAANGKPIDKPTLRFDGKEKMLVLCKTNAAVIQFVVGDTLEHAVGATITLQPRIIEAFGAQVVAIRVLPPEGTKVRHSVLKRLGRKAVWEPPNNKQEATHAEPAAAARRNLGPGAHRDAE